MKSWHKAFLATGLCLILGLQAIFTILLATPAGIRVDHPVAGRSVPLSLPVTGTAWMRNGIERIEVTARNPSTGAEVTVPGQRLAVKYNGAVAFLLSFWSAELVVPSEGAWELRALVVGRDGTSAATPQRVIEVAAGARLRVFRSWSPEHLVPLGLLLASWIALPLIVRRSNNARLNARVALALALVLWVDEIVYQLYWFGIQAWSAPIALMLQMCGLSILLIPIMFYAPSERVRRFLFEILYFWGLGGAVQALFVPDIGPHSFPEMKYLGYFISHGAIILSVLFAAAAWRIQLTARSLLRVFVVTNAAVVVTWGINQLMRFIPPWDVGNFFVMGYPPPQGSIVDLFASVFGPAPWYLVGLEVMGVVVFGLLYLPYPIGRMLRRRREATSPGPV